MSLGLQDWMRRVMAVCVAAWMSVGVAGCKMGGERSVDETSKPGQTRLTLDEGPPDAADQERSGDTPLPASEPEPPRDQKLQPGDYVVVELDGVPLPERREDEFRLTESGTISMPYLDPIEVVGLTPIEVGNTLEEAYRANEIYTNPKIRVTVNRDYVEVSGAVQRPRRVTFTRGLTFLSAVAAAGGFRADADRRQVLVRRGFRRYTVDAMLASQDQSQDPALQPGDIVQVSTVRNP